MRKHLLRLLPVLLFCCAAQTTKAQYCSAGTSYSCNYWNSIYIQNFSTTGGTTNITSNGSGCKTGGYTSFSGTGKNHTAVQGTTVNFSLTPNRFYYYYNCQYSIWVDLNMDGDFSDAGEQVVVGKTTTNTAKTGSFTVPITATPGTGRLRVRIDPYNTVQPCGKSYYGEVEDYEFIIAPACSTKFDKRIDAFSYACSGGDGSITVNASNGDKYKWQVMQNGMFTDLANGTNYSDVDKQTLKLHNTPASMAGTKFRCIVTPTCGVAGTQPSDTVALNIRPDVKTLSQMLADTTCIGVSTTLSFKASDDIKSSRWQMKSGGSSNFEDITSPLFTQNSDNLIINPVQDTLNGAIIRCVYNGLCGTQTTKDITLSVYPLPAVLNPPTDITVKAGATTYFNVVATGINVKYTWQVGINGAYANINNNAIYSGVKTDRLKVSGIARAQDGYQFRCLVSGTGSCAVMPDTSDFAVLSVEPPVSVKDVITDQSITIFPSPAKGENITVKVDTEVSDMLSKYVITDKLGKTLNMGNLVETGNTKINVSQLPADVYFIQVFDKNNDLVKSVKFTRL